MSGPLPLDRLLDALPRFVLVAGKGGVGKTTCAAALALRAAERSAGPDAAGSRAGRTLLLTTDPAATLAEAIEAPLGAAPAPVEGVPGLDAFRIDARAEREAFLARWREVLVTIVDRGTYLDREDIDALVDVAFPGADEVFAVLRLAAIARSAEHARVIVDTAPTGHTLRLLALPRTFDAMLRLLETMQDKHRFVVHALTHRYRSDAADAFLEELRGELAALRAVLADPARAAALVVGRDEPVVRAETARLVAALGELGIAVGARLMNAVADAPAAMDATHVVPAFSPPPEGREGVRRWMRALRETAAAAGDDAAAGRPSTPRAHATASSGDGPVDPRSLVRSLTIVGGKGGVGKTTVACALAIAAARGGHATLLVSTDPAPSVGDALGMLVPDDEVAVPGVPGLVARQMDAAAAFERLRQEYQQRLDEVFAGFLGAGFDAAHDRAILRELLALAPPGIDELYAMASLGATVEEGRFARVVVDPAPTGHLLRLLEIPALALDWTHRLMRLLLKYREVAGPGDLAGVLLEQARRTRALQALLHDPVRAGVVVVALDEPLVRGETARLAHAVRALGVDVTATVWNRVHARGAPPGGLALPEGGARVQLIAPPREPPPVGVEALAAWSAEWRQVTPAPVA